MHSTDGFSWTPSSGRQDGLPTIGAVEPPTHYIHPEGDVHDVIVIGAGYAGLVASRDLATQGRLRDLAESLLKAHICAQAKRHFSWKPEIDSEAARGMPQSMVSTTRWVELGFIGTCHIYTARSHCMAYTTTGSSPRTLVGRKITSQPPPAVSNGISHMKRRYGHRLSLNIAGNWTCKAYLDAIFRPISAAGSFASSAISTGMISDTPGNTRSAPINPLN